jgi:spore germination protein GerM
VKWGIAILAVMVVVLVAGGMYYALEREETNPIAPKVEETPGTRSVELVFAGEDGGTVREDREVLAGEMPEDDLARVIAELAVGPRGGGASPLPEGTAVRHVFHDGDGRVTLDLSREAQRNHPGGSEAERATMQCLLATIGTNFLWVDEVQILIEGRPVATLAGHTDLSGAFPLAKYR